MGSPSHTSFFYLLFLISFSHAIQENHYPDGITASLSHRDSPHSPFYDSSLTRYDRFQNVLHRSIYRYDTLINRIADTSEIIQSPLSHGGGEFLMHFSIGTPPVEFVAIIDTGSIITWIQCLPCKQCYNQSQPLFNPRQSSSYRRVSCTSKYCSGIGVNCGSENRTCEFNIRYADESYTIGELGYETITLGSSSGHPFFVRNTIIGCGHNTTSGSEIFGSGLVGLGGGDLSFITQLNKTLNFPRRFSYCLPSISNDFNSSGEIHFGRNAIVSGPRVVSTPLILQSDIFYLLTLEGISVGQKRIPIETAPDHAAMRGKGNIMIDSGTMYTYLNPNVYKNLISNLEKVIKAKRVDAPSDSGLLKINLCYGKKDELGNDIKIPIITFHFTGADVNLKSSNTFKEVAENVICLTILPSRVFSIFGNLAQMNFLIGYDLDEKKVYFKPM